MWSTFGFLVSPFRGPLKKFLAFQLELFRNVLYKCLEDLFWNSWIDYSAADQLDSDFRTVFSFPIHNPSKFSASIFPVLHSGILSKTDCRHILDEVTAIEEVIQKELHKTRRKLHKKSN